MTVESSNHSEGFYTPIQSFPKTRDKICHLLAVAPATISDIDLFEGIADTHSTIATLMVKLGVKGMNGPLAVEDLKCIDFETSGEILGQGYNSLENMQSAYIDMDNKRAIHFYRNIKGGVMTTFSDFEVDDDPGHLSTPDASERRRIIEELMNCLDLRNRAII